MQKRILISTLKEEIGNEVRIRGRVDTIRDQGKILFLLIKDRSGIVQAIAWGGDNSDTFQTAKKLTEGSIVDIVGKLKGTKQVTQGYEIEISQLKVDSLSETPLPIVVEEEHRDNLTSLEQRLDYRWIDLRSKKNTLMIEISGFVLEKLREFCTSKDFKEIQTPKIISSASEGGSDVFEVKYFDKKAYLAQSPQFHKQMAMAADLERVFSVGPAFRAEKSYTTRHLTEYTSFDVEISYIDSFKDVCQFEEELLNYVLSKVEEIYGKEIKEIFGIDITSSEKPFAYISVHEGKEKLAKEGIESKGEGDFSPEEERTLSEIVEKETGSEFLFVTDYPHNRRAFYHMKDSNQPVNALGFDLLWKGVEITTGAQREHRLEELINNAKEKNIPIDSLEEYLEYFKFGCPPHGGFAIGIERFLMKLLDYSTVLETSFLPNTPNRLGRRIEV
jgi:nondiscriminating aspartyl-tRNA synthetase